MDEGGAVLMRLNDLPLELEKVQQIEREVLLAIKVEAEASASLRLNFFQWMWWTRRQ